MKKRILSAAVFVMMLVSLAGCYWGFEGHGHDRGGRHGRGGDGGGDRGGGGHEGGR
jgi:hypothetical protein